MLKGSRQGTVFHFMIYFIFLELITSDILFKSKQPDSDFRYMALSDLINQLKSDKFKLDTNMEKEIVNAILKLLTHNDEVSEVKSFGVKRFYILLYF